MKEGNFEGNFDSFSYHYIQNYFLFCSIQCWRIRLSSSHLKTRCFVCSWWRIFREFNSILGILSNQSTRLC